MKPMEFTGERFIPGQGGVQLAYEHLHRYRFAVRLGSGKRVLDVASGSGYGAALLANAARQVWAIDIDGPALKQARLQFDNPNLCFINADAACLPFTSGSMDLIAAFEVIEHLRDPERLIRELARILGPDGVALISTPDKAVYSDAREYVNPYHVREFYQTDFLELLRAHFGSVQLLHQQVRAGSLIAGQGTPDNSGEILLGPAPDARRAGAPPMYFLAVCGDHAPQGLRTCSAYFDPSDSLIGEWALRLASCTGEVARLNEEIRSLGRWGKEMEGQIAQRDETLGRVLQEVGERDRTVVRLQESMDSEIGARDKLIQGLQSEMETEVRSRDALIGELQRRIEAEVGARDRTIQNLQEEMGREIVRRDEALQALRLDFEERTNWALSLQTGFEERTKWALSLQDDVRARDERLAQTNSALEAASAHLARIRHAFLYRVLCRMGILPK